MLIFIALGGRAIMKYHSIKMDEVNQILEELWKKTYQGTDVDTILIRSENESAQGNRSYNYRVSLCRISSTLLAVFGCPCGRLPFSIIYVQEPWQKALPVPLPVQVGLLDVD